MFSANTSSSTEIELQEIQPDETNINSLPNDLLAELMFETDFALALLNRRFYGIAGQLFSRRLHQQIQRIRANPSFSSSYLRELSLLVAAIKHVQTQFQDESIKLAKIGLLILRTFEIMFFLTQQEIFPFTYYQTVREFHYVGAGHYQWIEVKKQAPFEEKNMAEILRNTQECLDILAATPTIVDLSLLITNVRQLHTLLDKSVKPAEAPRKRANLFSLFVTMPPESEQFKIVRLLSTIVEKMDQTILQIEPPKAAFLSSLFPF